jgi:broad specificity phosphatase PhoE
LTTSGPPVKPGMVAASAPRYASTRLAELLRRPERQAFPLVLVSPLQRARETCELAGVAASARIEPDLVYGKYEGLTPEQIHEQAPG